MAARSCPGSRYLFCDDGLGAVVAVGGCGGGRAVGAVGLTNCAAPAG